MDRKPTSEELEQRVRDLEEEALREGVAGFTAEDTRTADALEALRKSEEMIHVLLDATTEAVYLLDLNGNFLLLNEITAKRFGKKIHELKGVCAWDLLPPDIAHVRKAHFEEVVRTGRPKRFEDRMLGRWFDCRFFPVFDEGGYVARVAVFARNITLRKRAEESLADTLKFTQTLIEAAPLGILAYNTSGETLFTNQAVARMIGASVEEVKRQNFRRIESWKRSGLVDAAEAALASGKEQAMEVHTTTTFGKDVWLWARFVPFSYRGEPHLLALFEDLAERKHAEEALRDSEERYRNILEGIEEGYYEVDLAGNFTFFNDPVCKLLGYTRDEMMGVNDREYTDPESAKKLFTAFNEVYRTGRPTKGFDWEVIRKDGTRRFVEASVSLLRDEEGNATGFRGIARDVTLRKQAEQEKRRLEAQLQQAQKLEAIGTLAGGVAHDFNNILMGIQGRASMMMMGMDPSHAHYEYLRGIEEYVRSAADLTKQLLGFASGGGYELKPTYLNDLVDGSATLFGRTRKEITLFRKFQPGLWSVEVDRRQIEQVLLNLFVNAWQAMPAGGDLHLETENVVLEENYVKTYGVKPGPYVKLSVTDTGVGMDEATMQRIFDPFFTTKGMGRGTGLGLASAYGIINNHKGIITVDSKKGYGSTFNIYLPASEKEVSGEKQPTVGLELAKGEGIVLLIDDEEMILEVGRLMLENLGYQVLEARSGREALEIYRQNKDRVRVVVLDMVMPQMGGEQTFDQLKAINPDVRVLLASGYSINGKAQEILNRGCDGFIQKPFSYSDLSMKLGEILKKVQGAAIP